MILVWLLTIVLLAETKGYSSEICRYCDCNLENANCSARGFQNNINDTLPGIKFNQLNLEYNKFVHVTPFPYCEIIHLTLRHNEIARIEDSSFKNIRNLTILDLSHNHLTSDRLNPHIFRGNYSADLYEPLFSLKVLRLSGNSLHTLNADLFEHLGNLEELAIDSNPFKMLDIPTVIAISNLPQLQVLDLSDMMLEDLPETMFHTPKYLEVVNISANFFTSVPQNIGESHVLEELVIDSNPIEELTSFPHIKSLKILRMNYMPKLQEIKDHALGYLINLEEIYCSNNPLLSKISGSALSTPQDISEAKGEIKPPVKKIFLRSNNLRTLDSDLLAVWENLEALDIQNNPWLCDCENQWLISTLIPEINTNHLNHTAGLRCYEPIQMRGNSMKELSEKNYQMRCLDLYGNHPERDASVLIGVLIGVLLAIPVVLVAITIYRRRVHSNVGYSRAFYRRTGSMESFP